MAAPRVTTGLITRSPRETAGRPPPRPAAGQQPQAAQSAEGARSVEASVRSGRSGYRLPVLQCAPGWPGEAGANRGCLKPGMDEVRNALRAPPASAVRHGRSALATRARAQEAEQLAELQAVFAVFGQRVRASSPGSKPRVSGSCFRRHWGATVSLVETTQNGRIRCSCGTTVEPSDRTERDAIGRSGTWAGAMGGQRAAAGIESCCGQHDTGTRREA